MSKLTDGEFEQFVLGVVLLCFVFLLVGLAITFTVAFH